MIGVYQVRESASDRSTSPHYCTYHEGEQAVISTVLIAVYACLVMLPADDAGNIQTLLAAIPIVHVAEPTGGKHARVWSALCRVDGCQIFAKTAKLPYSTLNNRTPSCLTVTTSVTRLLSTSHSRLSKLVGHNFQPTSFSTLSSQIPTGSLAKG